VVHPTNYSKDTKSSFSGKTSEKKCLADKYNRTYMGVPDVPRHTYNILLQKIFVFCVFKFVLVSNV
jgi:hypothetical protein